MSREDKVQKPFYLLPSVLRRVEKERVARGMTFQSFILTAVFEKLEKCEAEADRRRGKRREREEEEEPRRSPGLGIRDRLAEASVASEREPEETEAPARSAPVTVNVSQSSSGGGAPDLVSMARMIAAVAPSARKPLLQQAGEQLALASKTPEEAEALVERLDIEIKKADGRPGQTALDRVRARAKK